MRKIILYLTMAILLIGISIGAADNFSYITNGGTITFDPIIISGTNIACSDVVGASYDVCVGGGNVSGGGTFNLTDNSLNSTSNILGVNRSVIQNRVSGTCAVGEAVRIVNEDGTVTCESISGNISVTGFNLTDNSLNSTGLIVGVNRSVIQNRVSTNCGLNKYMSQIDIDGNATCQNDEDTQLSQVQVWNFMNVSNYFQFLVDWNNILNTPTLLNSSVADATYLRLDVSNDPMQGNIDHGTYNITNSSCIILTNGQPICWNADAYTINVPTGLGNIIQVGQERTRIRKNKAGKTIYAGQLVYDSGSQGEMITVDLADASNGSKIYHIGMVTISSCPQNSACPITYAGDVNELNTIVYPEQTALFLSDDGSGNITDILPSGDSYHIRIGTVSRSHASTGIIDFEVSIDLSDEPVMNNLKVLNNLNVSGNLSIGSAIYLDGITLKPLDVKNPNIAGPAYGIYMTGPSGQNLPHFILQSGGASQASVLLRSQMIANEIAGFHNTSNATDCVAYMNEIGETLKIDCNTTTTGADLLVSDDIQVVGDTWLKDTNGEWHFMTRELDLLDAQKDKTVISRINTSLVADNFTITQYNGKNLLVNLQEEQFDLGKSTDSILLTAGIGTIPQFNQIYYDNYPTPTIDKALTLTSNKADVGYFLIGSGNKNYGSITGSAKMYDLNRGIYERFYDDGAIYISGFDINASSTDVNIDSGVLKLIMERETISINHNFTDYVRILSNGTFKDFTSLNDITLYRDNEIISNAKYFNIVLYVAYVGDGNGKLYAVVQSKPSTEYNSILKAEQDIQNTVEYFPQNDFIRHIGIPIARIVVQKSGGVNTIQLLSNGQYYFDIRGQVTSSGGAAPSPSITSHAALSELEYSVSGHTGFMSDSGDTSTGNYIFEGNVTASILNLTDGLLIGVGAEGIGVGAGGYMSVGNNANAGGGDSIAIGTDTYARGGNSFALGYGAETNGNSAFSIGVNTFADGEYSYAFGRNINVTGNGSVGFNLDNTNYEILDNNVLSIMGGNVGIGTISPSQELEVIGNINVTGTMYGNLDWTNLQNYPTGCTATQTVRTIGDTLTCVDNYNTTADFISAIEDNTITFSGDNIHNGNEIFYGTVTIANIDSTTINSTIELQKLNGDIAIRLDANTKADYDVDINITSGNDVCIESGNCLSDMTAGITWDTPINTSITVDTDNVYDIGNTTHKLKDIYVDGTGYIDTISTSNSITTGVIRSGYASGYGFQSDLDTYIAQSGSAADDITINAGGVQLMYFQESTQDAVIINNLSSDIDFIVKSDGDDYNIFSEGSTNRVGIGIGSPGEKLHVAGNINVTSGNDVCVEGGNCLSDVVAYSAGGVLLDLTGTVFSVNEGTLTDDTLCNYEATGTQLECTTVVDTTGACASGSVCTGDNTYAASSITAGTFAAGNYVFTTGTLDADTLNTGQGDNELYDMDQDVQSTDDVTFNNVTITTNVKISGNVIVDAENKYCFNAGCTRYMWENSTGHIQIIT